MRITPLLAMLIINATGADELAEAQRIRLIKTNCYTCHAPADAGVASNPIPSLGNSAAGIAALLLDYKYDRRAGTIMNRIAKALTDEDIHLLSARLSGGMP